MSLPERLSRVVTWSAPGALCLAALACTEAAPGDAASLSSLSTGQLRALCAELEDTWAAERDLLACDDGSTHQVDRSGLAACGSQTTSCSATAGQWRACMHALFEDSCGRDLTRQPAECAELLAAEGCVGLALPLRSQCAAPSPEFAAAFDGVYEVLSRTENTTDCATEGPEVPSASHLALAAVPVTRPALALLQVTPAVALQYCDTLELCQQAMAELLADSQAYAQLTIRANDADVPGRFVCAPDSSGALLDSAWAATFDPECEITRVESALRLEVDGTVRLEQRTIVLPPPADTEPCSVPLEAAAAQQGSCVGYEVTRARRVAPL